MEHKHKHDTQYIALYKVHANKHMEMLPSILTALYCLCKQHIDKARNLTVPPFTRLDIVG